MNFINKLSRQCSVFSSQFENVQYLSVRYRYWIEKVRKGPLLRNFGYQDKIFKGGLLPRLKDQHKLPVKDYRPKNAWSEKAALFGQNDYIDILGDGKLHPVNVSYEVPNWLRGVRGTEIQLLIRKAKVFGSGPFADEYPSALLRINKRIRYLYKYLNRKTKTGVMKT